MTKLDNIIAFKGKVTLDKAVWDNIWGMYVTFELEQRPHELLAANPFKKFTKMKKGKVGTRFAAVIVDEDEEIVYDDELMLKGWNDGTTGWRVTFWLQGTDAAIETHPFIEYEKGTGFGLAAVELDDDQEPIDQVKRERVKEAVTHRKQGLSNFAALLCRTLEFHAWLEETQGCIVPNPEKWEDAAKVWMCGKLNIKSRAELDTNTVVAGQFHAQIRRPYADWMEKQ